MRRTPLTTTPRRQPIRQLRRAGVRATKQRSSVLTGFVDAVEPRGTRLEDGDVGGGGWPAQNSVECSVAPGPQRSYICTCMYVCVYVILIIRCDKRTSNNKHKKQSQNEVQYKAAKPKKTISLDKRGNAIVSLLLLLLLFFDPR